MAPQWCPLLHIFHLVYEVFDIFRLFLSYVIQAELLVICVYLIVLSVCLLSLFYLKRIISIYIVKVLGLHVPIFKGLDLH